MTEAEFLAHLGAFGLGALFGEIAWCLARAHSDRRAGRDWWARPAHCGERGQ